MSETIDKLKAATSAPEAKGNHETVSVACKLPNGLVLQNFAKREHREPVMGGGVREVEQYHRLEETYTLHGNAVDIDRIRRGEINHLIIGGFGVTSGIPKEFWDRWLEANQHSELVRGRFIFALKNENDLRAEAQGLESLRSGLEPVNPDHVGHLVRGVQPGTREAA